MPTPRISYFMDNDIGGYYYGKDHPMQPHRVCMAHNLVLAYGLYRKMEVYRPRKASSSELRRFHAADYVSFLRRVTPDNANKYLEQLSLFNLHLTPDFDCPVFDGLFEYCQTSVGASIDGAHKLMEESADVAVNWAGGMHHAKKSRASGFCYANDIVLAILELLKLYPRVLYIDIDVHHGDGVEEAFYVTDRVMTVSFHKFGNNYFPNTGDIWDKGAGRGEYYSVNCPLKDGITDAKYQDLFNPVITKVMEMFRPSAVVLQCGADSLCYDPLGPFNLTLEGHGKCVQFVRSFNIPTLVLGGGGYNIRSVARCWAFETGLLLDTAIDNVIPYNDYWSYFAPDHKLHFSPAKVVDRNSNKYVTALKEKIMENLRCLQAAPAVEMQEVPSRLYYASDEEVHPDKRDWKGKKRVNGEFYDH